MMYDVSCDSESYDCNNNYFLSSISYDSYDKKCSSPSPIIHLSSSSIKGEKKYCYFTEKRFKTLCSSSTSTLTTTRTKNTPAALIVRSSSLKTNNVDDYYEQCRIDILRSRMDNIQINSFLKFVNYHISKRGHKIHDISKDLSNGQILIDLIEILSSNKLPREKGRTYFHSMRNVQIVLNYLKSDKNLTHLNICPKDVVGGNMKQILALLWLIMKTFNFNGFRLNKNKNYFNEKTLFYGQDRSQLLKWLNDILNKILLTSTYIYVKDFLKNTWFDGYYLSLLCKFICPLSLKYQSLTCGHQCLKLIQQINDNNYRLENCFKLINLCFDIQIDNYQFLIDENFHTEKLFFSYFCELQRCIVHLFKQNKCNKLTLNNNPYSKIILETIMDDINGYSTSSHSSSSSLIESIDDDYLICIDENDIMNLSINEQNGIKKQNDLITVTKSRTFKKNEQNNEVLRKNRWTIVVDDIPCEFQTNIIKNPSQNELITHNSDNGIIFNVSDIVDNIEINLYNNTSTVKNDNMPSVNNNKDETINKNNMKDLHKVNKATEVIIVNGRRNDDDDLIPLIENVENNQPILEELMNNHIEKNNSVLVNNNIEQKYNKSKQQKKSTIIKEKIHNEDQGNISEEKIVEIPITDTAKKDMSTIFQEVNSDKNEEKKNGFLQHDELIPKLKLIETMSYDATVPDEINANHFTEKTVDNSVSSSLLSTNKCQKRKMNINNKKENVLNEVSTTNSKDLIPNSNHSFYRLILHRGLLSKTHNPFEIETKWNKIFQNSTTNSYLSTINENKPSFVMLFPPPNVTGTLHLGHALTASIHDCLLRWKAMNGYHVQCIPGYDHAGIATQVIVEKHIQQEYKLTREQIGYDKFMEQCYYWSDKYRDIIEQQLKRLGLIFDWNEKYFTMDQQLIEQVRETFLKLYNNQLIYRDKRIVNWCSKLKSVVSDIEVEYQEIIGRTKYSIPDYSKQIDLGLLYNIAYKILDKDNSEEIIVSTTRPETILGDTAIAINPNDDRYKHLHNGKYVENPFDKNYPLKIILDETVDISFGTGVVKITPGHDLFDYNLAKKHNLDIKTILDDSGYISLPNNHDYYKQLNSLHRYDARDLVLNILNEKSLLRGISEQQRTTIPICSRTGDIIEPLVKEQWFLNMQQLGEKALNVIDNQLKLTPDFTRKLWKQWLNNVKPWCLSRQLYWGHSIPMYKCSNGEWIDAHTYNEALSKAKHLFPDQDNLVIEQDKDVLDTWFSSGLLPISVFFKRQNIYPTSLLETGYDIMFFWVARMVMLSLKLTDQLPFNEVLFHGLICDPNGKKMSKSLGNIIDPIDVIDGISLSSLQKRLDQSHLSKDEILRAKNIQKQHYPNGIEPIGADGLRLCLLSQDILQQTIKIDPLQFDYVGRYCNKIWNAYKYVTEHALSDIDYKQFTNDKINYESIQQFSSLRTIDRWMLQQLNDTIRNVNLALQSYSFNVALVHLRESFIKDFCDFYIEFSKRVVKNGEIKRNIQILLYYLLKQYLLLYHPFIPSLTEELWNALTDGKQQYLINKPYPIFINEQVSNPDLNELIKTIRMILKQCSYLRDILRLRECESYICITNQPQLSTELQTYLNEIRMVSRLHHLKIVDTSLDDNRSYLKEYVNDNIEIIVKITDQKLVKKEYDRITKHITKLKNDIINHEIKIKEEQEDIVKLKQLQSNLVTLEDDLKRMTRRQERFSIVLNRNESDSQQKCTL
ncbi:unnamed protein product [Didymodactylos carnosus]|uniref:valine--tRNA ligase n=1 Tax=Didymodactylos carnosus TaxID=1234261 RepID=A0A813PNY3_9BILA|nr:unnamed protein product [Didymodactylos carnosus]CAF0771876.1 unnamed protein product [Didymodactylos carnosus]CAF3537329.1 unnamed protein product [Didymodactylos carnosus]CAF3552718.1 unnamed protein product [Didymodactylos carnosus]